MNKCKWRRIENELPPKNTRVLTINMGSLTPVIIDNIYQENGTFMTNNSPTHWTEILNFPDKER